MEMKDYNVDILRNAIKNLDNFLWGIANNVVCTICQELFTEAVTVQCGHNYCLKCIKKLHSTSKNGKVNCPLCRHPIKRRTEIVNPILSKIAEIFSEAPAAFQEDVKKLTMNFEGAGEDMIKSSRLSGLCEEKVKNELPKKTKGRRKGNTQQAVSNDSIVWSSISSNNEGNVDFKSISQLESKSESCVSDSSDLEKRLKNVKRVPGKKKVSDWLKDVDRSIISAQTLSENNINMEDSILFEPNDSKVNESGSSMVRIDYIKSKKSDGLSFDKTLTLGKDDDPYEFIASQRNSSPKRKRASRGRKREIPQFEAIQTFDKNSIKKHNHQDTSGVLDIFDDDDSIVGNVKKPVKTYATRSNRSRVLNYNKKQDIFAEDIGIGQPQLPSKPSENSYLIIDVADDESDIISKPSARRRLLSSLSDENSDSNAKKPKLNTPNGGCNAEEVKKSGGSSKCSESPGWSRVSNLKMDFETHDKRKPCRKTLNISGGELNVNTSKVKDIADVSLEGEEPITIPSEKDIYIEDLSQSSELVVGFDSQQSPKKEFKDLVDSMEKELEGIEKSKGVDANLKVDEKKQRNEISRKTSNRKTIPFSLLGKITRKKRKSIVFLKMGRLSPYLRKCDTTVVKLLFPSKTVKKTSIGLQTEEHVQPQMVFPEDSTFVEGKANVAVQTLQCPTTSKEVQTQLTDSKNVPVQTEPIQPPQILEEFSTTRYDVRGEKQVIEVDFDTELQNELNKTWAATQGMKSEKEETITVKNDYNELMQCVIDNIKLDLARAKNARTPVKIANPVEKGEESDSDIFIEQTPPREASTVPGCKTEEVQSTEESYLILSNCDNKIYATQTTEEQVKQHQNNENDQNKLNQKTGKKGKICIISSGIRNRKLIEKFVDKFKVEHLNSPRKDVTHLVVGLHENEDDELVPFCTPKFLYAMANKKWIVTETWLEECLKTNRIVAEEPFESVDPVGGNACKVARLSNDLLLENCEIHLFGKFVSITKEEFAELIRDCGGTIISNLTGFSYARKKIRMILIDGSDLPEENEFKAMSIKYRTLVMSRDVAIMSIQGYQIVNFTPFVQHTFSTEECVKWGYPSELVKKDNIDSDGESQP